MFKPILLLNVIITLSASGRSKNESPFNMKGTIKSGLLSKFYLVDSLTNDIKDKYGHNWQLQKSLTITLKIKKLLKIQRIQCISQERSLAITAFFQIFGCRMVKFIYIGPFENVML